MPPSAPDQFFDSLFASKPARARAVLCRKIQDAKRTVIREKFLADLKRPGWSAVENAGQFVITCNAHAMRGVL